MDLNPLDKSLGAGSSNILSQEGTWSQTSTAMEGEILLSVEWLYEERMQGGLLNFNNQQHTRNKYFRLSKYEPLLKDDYLLLIWNVNYTGDLVDYLWVLSTWNLHSEGHHIKIKTTVLFYNEEVCCGEHWTGRCLSGVFVQRGWKVSECNKQIRK